MPEREIIVPEEWMKLDATRLAGLVMVIGAPDTGKSTLSAYLYERIIAAQGKAAYLDGDPGQSALGPPTTITLAVNQQGDVRFPPGGRCWRKFIGSTSPSGHMLPLLVGAARLVKEVNQAGCSNIIYDTCGMVEANQGGQNLKYAKFDLLQPSLVLALQRENELEPLLSGLRRSHRCEVVTLQPSSAVQPRSTGQRQAHRAAKFAIYFHAARVITLDWMELAVLPAPNFGLYRLAALEDGQGFTLGLGIILGIQRRTRQLELLTPLHDTRSVRSLMLGDLSLDPQTFKDQRLGFE